MYVCMCYTERVIYIERERDIERVTVLKLQICTYLGLLNNPGRLNTQSSRFVVPRTMPGMHF